MTWEFQKNGERLAFLEQRPTYCDRGRWGGVIEAPHWQSDADPAPRYYFDLDRAKAEMIAYMTAKKIDIEGGEWKPRYDGGATETFSHMIETGDMAGLAAIFLKQQSAEAAQGEEGLNK